jgi:long-chain acyl-CoA synthetase
VYVLQGGYPRFAHHGCDDLRAACSHPRDRDQITLSDGGRLDDEGFLYLTDRSKDLVISGGANIYTAEVEVELLALPGVRDCAVFGVPDDEYGEALLAVVQSEPGVVLDADVIQGHPRKRLAGLNVPRRIELRDELPREDTGKIFKRRLREAYWQDAGRSI